MAAKKVRKSTSKAKSRTEPPSPPSGRSSGARAYGSPAGASAYKDRFRQSESTKKYDQKVETMKYRANSLRNVKGSSRSVRNLDFQIEQSIKKAPKDSIYNTTRQVTTSNLQTTMANKMKEAKIKADYDARVAARSKAANAAKGTGRSGGIVSRIPGMRGGFFGSLGSSGARFGRK